MVRNGVVNVALFIDRCSMPGSQSPQARRRARRLMARSQAIAGRRPRCSRTQDRGARAFAPAHSCLFASLFQLIRLPAWAALLARRSWVRTGLPGMTAVEGIAKEWRNCLALFVALFTGRPPEAIPSPAAASARLDKPQAAQMSEVELEGPVGWR